MREFTSMQRYLQGVGIIKNIAEFVGEIGDDPLVISAGVPYEVAGKFVVETLRADYFDLANDGDWHQLLSDEFYQDVVIAVGGGAVIDIAKQVADEMRVPVVIVPTAASMDAPTSRLSVVYDEKGHFQRYRRLRQNPALVVVDTEIIANAPVDTLRAGIGDALATTIEAQAVASHQAHNFYGNNTTRLGQLIADETEKSLFLYSGYALEAAARHEATAPLDRLIEANVLFSGLGFENAGEAAGHAFYNAVSQLGNTMQHGYVVAFGALMQLFLCERDDDFDKYHDFLVSVDLPTKLSDLELSEADVLAIVEFMMSADDTTHNAGEVSAEELTEAILTVDRLSRERENG